MSRGFVKEGDQEEQIFIPPRASLPDGVVNYVTAEGLRLLKLEKDELLEELRQLSKEDETEYRRSSSLINGKLNLLEERLNSARVVDMKDQPADEVRFGAVVTFINGKNKLKFRIVGVDEADVTQQKIAFTAPIARILIGKRVGEQVGFHRGKEVQVLKIMKVEYLEN